MTQASNTPPDGDFVRYLEQLTARASVVAAAPMPEPDLRQAGLGQAKSAKVMLQSDSLAAGKVAAALAQTPFFTHVKWVIGLWVVSQLLARLLPGAGFLFVPALIAYTGWVLFRVNRETSGALVKKLREAAEAAGGKASEELDKTQRVHQKKNSTP
jgi:hypothetical protein